MFDKKLMLPTAEEKAMFGLGCVRGTGVACPAGVTVA